MRKRANGRKYFLTKVGLGLVSANMAACFYLALRAKLTGDFVTASTVFNGSVAALLAAFTASNAYTTGKAAEHGLLTKAEVP